MLVIALGSNLRRSGRSRLTTLRLALTAVRAEIGTVVRKSKLYRSTAWPDPNDPDFYNAAILVHARCGAREALRRLHRIEARLGRRRTAERNAPRPIDLDIIWSPNGALRESRSSGLVLPHPRAAERAFVLAPVRDITPQCPWVSDTCARSLITRSLSRGELGLVRERW